MDTAILSAQQLFRRIYIDGVPILLKQNETAFLSVLCVVAATDALAGYRYSGTTSSGRFRSFVENYFPLEYKPHTANLWLFRCRMLHNFSPAYFTVTHAAPQQHLQKSVIGDFVLDDGSFFDYMRLAAEKYSAELQQSPALQTNMLERLQDTQYGGSIHVAP